ncbi:hypothetical protein MaudCBS49596_003268 [Microsporum audouinii]
MPSLRSTAPRSITISHRPAPAASFSTTSKMQNKISEAVKTDRELEHYYQVIVNSTDPAEKTKYHNAFVWSSPATPKEHQILKVFHDTDADPKFMGLSDHIREEESVGLVKIEHLLDLTESDRMAASEQTKMFVPARSHPSAPTNRPLRLL